MTIRLAPAILAFAVAGCGRHNATITVDAATRHQAFDGWEASFQSWPDSVAAWSVAGPPVLDSAAQLGITRIRVHVRSGYERNLDGYAELLAGRINEERWRCLRYGTVNDNDDPQRLDEAGFRFTELDEVLERVLPLRQRLAARGDSLEVIVTYVAFTNQICDDTPYLHGAAEEYAEFAVATYRHIKRRFALEPAAWEVILEPDGADSAWADGAAVGRALVAAARRLRAEGFRGSFIVPSVMRPRAFAPFVDALLAVPGARELVGELSYHRYGPAGEADLDDIAERGRRLAAPTAMLEHITGDHRELYQDLTSGGVSAWQQYVLAYPYPDDNGAQLLLVDSAGTVSEGWRTRFLRPYFRAVRPGSVRVGASADDRRVRPVAFLQPGGGTSVVAIVDHPMRLTVRGLPPGFYRIAAAMAAAGPAMPFAEASDDSTLTIAVPAAGVFGLIPGRR